MDGLTKLILEACDQGYDVSFKFRQRTDGKPGELTIPNNWMRRLEKEKCRCDHPHCEHDH